MKRRSSFLFAFALLTVLLTLPPVESANSQGIRSDTAPTPQSFQAVWQIGQDHTYRSTLESERIHTDDDGNTAVTLLRIVLTESFRVTGVDVYGNASVAYGLDRLEVVKTDGTGTSQWDITLRSEAPTLPEIPDARALANLLEREVTLQVTPLFEVQSASGYSDDIEEVFAGYSESQLDAIALEMFSDDWLAKTLTRLWSAYGAGSGTSTWSQAIEALPLSRGLPYFWVGRPEGTLTYALDAAQSTSTLEIYDIQASFDPPAQTQLDFYDMTLVYDSSSGAGQVRHDLTAGEFPLVELSSQFLYHQNIGQPPTSIIDGQHTLLYRREMISNVARHEFSGREVRHAR